MKKYFIAVLTLALSFNLAACGSSASTGDSGQKAGGQESASASGETITINIGHGGAESTAPVSYTHLDVYKRQRGGGVCI